MFLGYFRFLRFNYKGHFKGVKFFLTDGPTDRPTDPPTDRPTDRPTDIPNYRSSLPELKKAYDKITKPIFENLQKKVDEILTKPFF